MSRKKRESQSAPDWRTPEARIRWLVETRFRGNRSAMAKTVGVSHTLINKVVGGQSPGRRLLERITANLDVNPGWLLTGQGVPFVASARRGAGLPVSLVPLPGLPLHHLDQTTDELVDVSELGCPTQYFLQLSFSESLLSATRGFCAGDLLLFEADRAKFPHPSSLDDHLCAVQSSVGGPRLASVTCMRSDEDAYERLMADTFDADPDQTVREDVYQTLPSGEVRHFVRRRELTNWRGRPRAADVQSQPIDYSDIVAAWTGILRRRP